MNIKIDKELFSYLEEIQNAEEYKNVAVKLLYFRSYTYYKLMRVMHSYSQDFLVDINGITYSKRKSLEDLITAVHEEFIKCIELLKNFDEKDYDKIRPKLKNNQLSINLHYAPEFCVDYILANKDIINEFFTFYIQDPERATLAEDYLKDKSLDYLTKIKFRDLRWTTNDVQMYVTQRNIHLINSSGGLNLEQFQIDSFVNSYGLRYDPDAHVKVYNFKVSNSNVVKKNALEYSICAERSTLESKYVLENTYITVLEIKLFEHKYKDIMNVVRMFTREIYRDRTFNTTENFEDILKSSKTEIAGDIVPVKHLKGYKLI